MSQEPPPPYEAPRAELLELEPRPGWRAHLAWALGLGAWLGPLAWLIQGAAVHGLRAPGYLLVYFGLGAIGLLACLYAYRLVWPLLFGLGWLIYALGAAREVINAVD